MDCFKYLGSQVAADGGCERDVVHRMNEGYRAWGALKSVLSNRGLAIKAKKCLYDTSYRHFLPLYNKIRIKNLVRNLTPIFGKGEETQDTTFDVPTALYGAEA